jgi:hypothetical protein
MDPAIPFSEAGGQAMCVKCENDLKMQASNAAGASRVDYKRAA